MYLKTVLCKNKLSNVEYTQLGQTQGEWEQVVIFVHTFVARRRQRVPVPGALLSLLLPFVLLLFQVVLPRRQFLASFLLDQF